jgi:hypothetical protein
MSARYPWAWSPVNTFDWDLGLSKKPVVDLVLETSGGQAFLDMSELRVEWMYISTSTTSTSITLPGNLAQVEAETKVAAASMVLTIPEDVAARIRVRKGMSTVEVDPVRFPTTDVEDEYCSHDDESAARRVEIRLNVGLGSVKIL